MRPTTSASHGSVTRLIPAVTTKSPPRNFRNTLLLVILVPRYCRSESASSRWDPLSTSNILDYGHAQLFRSQFFGRPKHLIPLLFYTRFSHEQILQSGFLIL